MSTVCAGPMLWGLDQVTEVMQWYREVIAQAPEDLNGVFASLMVPPQPPFPEHLHNKTMCGIIWCYTGPLDQTEATFEPIRRLHTPVLDLVGHLPYPELQSMFDALYPPGLQMYWKADFVKELSEEAIAVHKQYGSELPTL